MGPLHLRADWLFSCCWLDRELTDWQWLAGEVFEAGDNGELKEGFLLMELYTCSSFSLGVAMLHLWDGGLAGERGRVCRDGMEQEEVSLRCGVEDARASPSSLDEETKLASSPLL